MSTLAAITLGLHLATAHFGGEDMQPINPGIYMRVREGDLAGMTLGSYHNSQDRRSVYAAWTWESSDRRFALTVGGVTGYGAARVMPMLVPSTRVAIGAAGALRIAYLPKPVKDGRASGIHLSLEKDF